MVSTENYFLSHIGCDTINSVFVAVVHHNSGTYSGAWKVARLLVTARLKDVLPSPCTRGIILFHDVTFKGLLSARTLIRHNSSLWRHISKKICWHPHSAEEKGSPGSGLVHRVIHTHTLFLTNLVRHALLLIRFFFFLFFFLSFSFFFSCFLPCCVTASCCMTRCRITSSQLRSLCQWQTSYSRARLA